MGTLCDPITFAACLQCIKRVALPVKGGNAQQFEPVDEDTQMPDQGQDEEEGVSAKFCLAALEDLATYLQRHSMKGSPEMLSVLIDVSIDLTKSSVAAAAPARRGRASKHTVVTVCATAPRFLCSVQSWNAGYASYYNIINKEFQTWLGS